MKIKQSLQNISHSNGTIKTREALQLAERADQANQELIEMLERCKKHVGMFLGGEIAELLAKNQGIRFSEKEYNYEKTPEGQE